jgi:hypothetical protein
VKKTSTLVLLAALLFSCEPTRSTNPLSDPATAKADARLTGLWTGTVKDGDVATLEILPHGKGAAIDFVLIGDDGDKGAFVIQFDAFPSVIGGKSYLNLRPKIAQGEFGDPAAKVSDLYLFARYEVAKNGDLTLWTTKDEVMKDAVTSKALEGTVDHDDVKLSESTAKLSAWVEKAPETLWNKFGTFKKLSSIRSAKTPKK